MRVLKIAQSDSIGQGGRGEEASSLDTLAQPCQTATYQKRARSKSFSVVLATRLVEHAKGLGSLVMEKAYRNTIYCNHVIVQDDGKLTSRYCGNRWCLVCNRVRTAKAIEVYTPILRAWRNPYLVTLTVRNCSGDELGTTLNAMVKAFASCARSIRRTHGLEFRGMRKLECTYNARRDDYHPHYHVFVEGVEQAELLRALWLRRFAGSAELKGQDVRPCDSGSLHELFKYATKLVTKTKGKNCEPIPVAALHIIFGAMRGRRIWQPVGFTLPPGVEDAIEGEEIKAITSPAFKRVDERVYWQWSQGDFDWKDQETGQFLSDYVPAERYQAFIEAMARGSTRLRLTLNEESLSSG